MQSTWSGSIVFGMVSVPVQLYKATEAHAGPRFHQVHEPDGGRIRLKRFCEIEDREVPFGEIARGIETAEDEQLILTAKDFEKLPIPSRTSIEVLAFVDADMFDPMQYESAYYVGLGRRSPGKPYALLREAMRMEGKVAVSKVTLASRESLAILRVVDELLVLHTMLWPDEVRQPRGIAAPVEELHANELRMARSLMHALSEDFDASALHDEYREAVEALIDAKLADRPPSSPRRPVAASNVVDIMDVLARSLEAQRLKHQLMAGADEPEGGPAAKKTAAKAAGRTPAKTTSTPPAKKAAAKKSAPAARKSSSPRRRTG